ncbi:M23 family metallopeptidase [Carboxylicivirga sediminis]|uniref:M23 family metallopeptidase n=1 Tax=Carboxylicivirga sediminis TaxID=2006564 RepID=A0A941F366_9BACT|nr:peptidoglycan DD-metalloendopeptidase family protein [Carboxylicivirga sediminis]MBR8535464.1 M23 family metallopeptidase [Carboxylicivirga sediminis]
MKLKPSVSGSFGELRSNHFHSGLDLTTNRKTGYRVYASDKGHVSRIKVSPYGYGKAIYIDHAGGYTTVYAHLERYSDRIDSLVRAEQYKQQSFAVELFFKPEEVPVEREEIIGYSGNSGSSGGPHLHYEVREQATQKPINPLFFRDDIADDVRPQVQGMKLYCLADDASIDGQHKDKYIPAVFYEKSFHPKGTKTFTAHGKIGIGVQVLDYFSDSWRKCGIRSIDLFMNDTLVYNFLIDKFSFAETRYLNSHIDYAEKVRSGKVIQKSFVEPNNRLKLYGKKNTYTTELKEGDKKNFKYLIEDFAGNQSVLEFSILGEKALNIDSQPKEEALVQVSYNSTFTLDTLGFELSIPANALYTDANLFIHKEEKQNMIAPVYFIGDRYTPLHRSMKVSIPVPDSLLKYSDKLCVAGVSGSDKIYSLGGKMGNGRMSTETRSFGKFTLAVDTIAPSIKLRKAPEGNNYSARKTIELIISDSFSGIRSYDCYINGQWALFEYDAKNYRLTGSFKHMPFLKKGKHELTVKVVDNRGNVTTKTYNFST